MSHVRTVIVTGANRGIGRAICQAILNHPSLPPLRLYAASRSGDTLTFQDDASSPSSLSSTRDQPHQLIFPKLDISSPDSIHALVDLVARDSPTLDVLINNAGVNLDADYSPSSAKRTLDVNFRGTRDVTQAFLPLLRTPNPPSPRARVVNLSSVACTLKPYSAALQHRLRSPELSADELEEIAVAYERAVHDGTEETAEFGPPGRAYSLSKALVTGLTRVLAREEEGKGVSVNCCCPGWIDTEMGRLVGRRGNVPKTEEEGARIPVHLAFDESVEGLSGVYWANESVRSKGVGGVREW